MKLRAVINRITYQSAESGCNILKADVKEAKSVKAYKDKKWAEVFLEDKDIDDQLLINVMQPLANTRSLE